MVDLDTTATETVTLLNHLLDQVDQTQPDVEALHQDVEELSQQLDQNWQTLEDRMQSVLDHINQCRDDLATEADEVNQLLQDLQERAAALQTEAEATLDQTKDAMSDLEQNLASLQPDLATEAETTDSALTALQQSAEQIRSDLTATITALQEHLRSEVSDQVSAHDQALGQQSDEFNTYLTDDCCTEINAQVLAFANHISELLTELTDKLEQVQTETDNHADVSLKEVLSNQRELFDTLTETGNDVMETMARVSEVVQRVGKTFTTAKESLVTGAQTTNLATTTAIGLFEDVLSLLMI